MKITEVEAIVLRQPAVNDGIADGSQDDLIVRIHTDAGIDAIALNGHVGCAMASTPAST